MLFCLGGICFPRLIYCDQRWLLWFRCTYKTINSMKDFRSCFILLLFPNYFFSKITQPHPLKSYRSPQLTDLWIIFKFLLFDSYIYYLELRSQSWLNLYIIYPFLVWCCQQRPDFHFAKLKIDWKNSHVILFVRRISINLHIVVVVVVFFFGCKRNLSPLGSFHQWHIQSPPIFKQNCNTSW